MQSAEIATLWGAVWLLYLANHLRLVPLDWVGVVVSPLAHRHHGIARLILPGTPFQVGRHKQLVLLAPLRPDIVVINARFDPFSARPGAAAPIDSRSLTGLVIVQFLALPLLLVGPPLISLWSLAAALATFVAMHVLLASTAAWLAYRVLRGRHAVPCLFCATAEIALNFAAMPLAATLLLRHQPPASERLEAALADCPPAARETFGSALADRLADMHENNEITAADLAAYRNRLEMTP
jgi:hypothetical protein